MRCCRIFAWVALLLLAAAAVAGPVAASGIDVAAEVDRKSISLAETVFLVVTATLPNDRKCRVDVSPIKDFRVLSRESNMTLTMRGQNVVTAASERFRLSPKKTGRLLIPALPVSVGGESFMTRPITVEVTGAPPASSKEDGRDVFADASVTDKRPYVGEQIVYKLKLYYRAGAPILRMDMRDPDFTGFAAKRIPGRRNFSATVAGRDYNAMEYAFLLAPLKSGRTRIPGTAFHYDVLRRRPNAGRFPTSPFFLNSDAESKALSAPDVALDVRALPPYSGKDAFSGLMGEFSLQALADKKELAVGGAATVTIVLSGRGNIVDAPVPDLKAPPGCKLYKDAPEDHIDLTNEGWTGKKLFRYSLAPLRAGTLTLPPVEFVYFNPKTGAYAKTASKPLTFEVAPGQASSGAEAKTRPADEPSVSGTGAPSPQETPAAKQKVALTGRDILPVHEGLDALDDQAPMGPAAFFALLLAPPALFAGLFALRRRIRRERDAAGRMADRAARDMASARAAQADGNDEWKALCAKALAAAVFSRLGREGEALAYDEAEALLVDAGLPEAEALTVKTLMQRLDAARFGGGTGVRDALLGETADMMEKLCG